MNPTSTPSSGSDAPRFGDPSAGANSLECPDMFLETIRAMREDIATIRDLWAASPLNCADLGQADDLLAKVEKDAADCVSLSQSKLPLDDSTSLDCPDVPAAEVAVDVA